MHKCKITEYFTSVHWFLKFLGRKMLFNRRQKLQNFESFVINRHC